MRLKDIKTDTLLDYWASPEAELETDVFEYVRRMIGYLGYHASPNQVRLEILTRLRRYSYAPEKGRMSARDWQIAKEVYQTSKFRFRETSRGEVRVWRTDDYG